MIFLALFFLLCYMMSSIQAAKLELAKSLSLGFLHIAARQNKHLFPVCIFGATDLC